MVVSDFPIPMIDAIAVAILPALELEEVEIGAVDDEVVCATTGLTDVLDVGTITGLTLWLVVGTFPWSGDCVELVSAGATGAVDVVLAGAGASRVVEVLRVGLISPLWA